MARSSWLGPFLIGLTAASATTAFGQSPAEDLAYTIISDYDDGTEINRTSWSPMGVGASNLNRLGHLGTQSYDTALRFSVPDVNQGESFVYARVVLHGTGDGTVGSEVLLRVVGIDSDGVAGFSTLRPSRWPKTSASVAWNHTHDWPLQSGSRPAPLLRYTPNIAEIINAIVGRTNWGSTGYGKVLGLVIEDAGSTGSNFLTVRDYQPMLYQVICPRLELYRTVRSTFLGKELLGRPTDHSITINAVSLLTLEVYVEYGSRPDRLTTQTPTEAHAGGDPMEITLENLAPNSTYYYRLRFRIPGGSEFEAGPVSHFHTQRPRGSSFRFTVQADSHIWESVRQDTDPVLYAETLRNVALDDPDFHIDLGDTLFAEDYSGGDVLDFEDTMTRLISHRPFLYPLCSSTPLFLVLGNHEGEQGWRLNGTADNVAVWATNARKLLYPNPQPNDFYSGDAENTEFVGLRQDYYAFEWGDALFIALDPFWHTARSPHGAGGFPGSENNWDWSLGFVQYNWLRDVLRTSDATFKFVFLHQIVGGNDLYGRGGIEAAKHLLGGFGSFEWGGEDPSGSAAFSRRRAGWGRPIHRLLADNDATILFHAHDHVFFKQELDGIVYQECPQPADAMYGDGLFLYRYGDLVPNTGYLRVTVAPPRVHVEYVRAYLPGEGTSGEVAYEYEIEAP
jgi:hypothetical protein